MSKPKLAISHRALVQRVNRALAHEGQRLKANLTPGGPAFHLIDVKRGVVAGECADLEALARKLAVLAPFEEVSR